MQRNKVLIIASEGLTTNLLYEALSRDFEICKVLIETKESKSSIIKRRIRHVGLMNTIGQIHFMFLITPFLSSKKRIKAILKEKNLSGKDISFSEIEKIENINNPKTIELINYHQPDLVFINGTRIISKTILHQITVPVLNIHVGITPKYRGVHGGYWSIYNNDEELFGTTLHYVDSGVDTGGIIDQSTTQITTKDNFKTYPILQYTAGLQLITKNIIALKNEEIETKKSITIENQLHYHPTFFQYLTKRITKGVK